MTRYLKSLLRAICGDESIALGVFIRVTGELRAERDRAVEERDAIRARYEALLAAATEFRHKSWEVTHR